MAVRPTLFPPALGGAAMRTQTAVGVLLLALVILVAAGIQVLRLNG